MRTINVIIFFFFLSLCSLLNAQWDFSFNYNSAGQRVALVEATVEETPPSITLHFIDHIYNDNDQFTVSRRPLHGGGDDWVLQTTLDGGTSSWTDTEVSLGAVWEYQVKRDVGGQFATGYVSAGIKYDQTNYKGRMIVLIDATMTAPLVVELEQLKRDLTGEGWYVFEVYANRVEGWDSGDAVITVKQQIQEVWDAAPEEDKPSHLFIVGHVPVPRSGQDTQAPDGHNNSNGAVGSDTYYADLDGVYTDDATYDPDFVLYDVNAVNLPNDSKWDQDFIPSELELAFGRIDFLDIGSYASSEEQLLKNYLDRLHNYRMVVDDMGEKSAFRLGWANSYDGSYRSLIPISGSDNVILESGSSNHPEWVSENGPFQAYLQNSEEPSLEEWDTHGMNSVVYTSDQSFWGHWSLPETGGAVGKIRALLAADTKCLVALWQTTAVNVFYQPGIGETMGISCKRIMDHNLVNNIIEKPETPYDTDDFWNRTHMQYHGDPSLRLFQVYPVSDLSQTVVNGSEVQLDWTASIEEAIVGYHIYKCDAEFGQYQKISSELIVSTSFTDTVVTVSNGWFMVRAVKHQTTGSGSYLNPSTGIFIQSTYAISVSEETQQLDVNVYPNPTTGIINIKSANVIESVEVTNEIGQIIQFEMIQNTIDLGRKAKGVYYVKVVTVIGEKTEKIIVEF